MDDQSSRSLAILERLAGQAPKDDPKTQNYIEALRHELESEAREREEREKTIAAYAEAYDKLTAPANRVGVFLRHLPEGLAIVALADSEYVAQIDPTLEPSGLSAGQRVRLNEAYAIVGMVERSQEGALLKVAEALEDGRLRVATDPQNQQGRLVGRGAEIADVIVREGDEVRLEPSGRLAVEHMPKRDVRDYFVEEIPEMPWDKVGGQQEAIALIRETIEHPLLYPELYARYDKKPVKGVLLYGPPGCGKTLIGKATAYNLAREYSKRLGKEVKECFMHISGPKILNMWLGETERMVREIFSTARARAKEGNLVVIFIDEAESILRTRSSGRWLNISNTVVPQFCAEMDGMVELENVVLIVTTNRPDYIDPAVLRPERIDRKVKIRRPNAESAREILRIYLHERLPLDVDFVRDRATRNDAGAEMVDLVVDFIWRAAPDSEFMKVGMRNGTWETLYWRDFVSGALLKSVVDRAKDMAIRRAIASPSCDSGISLEDLQEAVRSEFKENEIFPKSEAVDDWLKLLDLEPESVVNVRPVRTSSKTGHSLDRTIV